jgi:hypothetical protein
MSTTVYPSLYSSSGLSLYSSTKRKMIRNIIASTAISKGANMQLFHPSAHASLGLKIDTISYFIVNFSPQISQ